MKLRCFNETTEPIPSIVVCPFIFRLLTICSPSAICRAIISVIVNSIKSQSVRAISHIFKKMGERMFPSTANFNPTATISFVIFASWIATSVYHAIPRFVCFGMRAAMSFGILISTIYFSSETPAAFCLSSSEVICSYNFGCAAITNTEASRFSIVCELGKHDHTTISLSQYS